MGIIFTRNESQKGREWRGSWADIAGSGEGKVRFQVKEDGEDLVVWKQTKGKVMWDTIGSTSSLKNDEVQLLPSTVRHPPSHANLSATTQKEPFLA